MKWPEFSRQLGAVAALISLAFASLLLMQCTYAFLLDSGEPRSELWPWLTVASILVAIMSLVAYRRLEPSSRYFLAPMAATPVVMVLQASMLSTNPLPEPANLIAVYALMAGYLALMIRGLRQYVRDPKQAASG